MDTKENKLPKFADKNLVYKVVNRTLSIILVFLFFSFIIAIILSNIITIDISIESTGILEPKNINKVFIKEQGYIKSIHRRSGQLVRKNSIIAILDSEKLLNQLTQLEKKIEQVQNKLTHSKALLTYEQSKNLMLIEQADINLIKSKAKLKEIVMEFFPEVELDSLIRDYKAGVHINLDKQMADYLSVKMNKNLLIKSRGELEFKKYDIKDMQLELDNLVSQKTFIEMRKNNLEIKSNSRGFILTDEIDNLVGSYLNEGTLFCEIAELDKWKINLIIPENEIHQVHTGDSVKIELNALKFEKNNILYTGYIISMSSDIIVKQNTNEGYKVVAELCTETIPREVLNKLKRGYTVKANIISDSDTIFNILMKRIKEIIN